MFEIAIRHKSSGRIHRRVNELQVIHSDLLMTAVGGDPSADPHFTQWETGFVDSTGNFLSRAEANVKMIAVKDIQTYQPLRYRAAHTPDLLLLACAALGLQGQPHFTSLGQALDSGRLQCGFINDAGQFVTRSAT